MTGGFELAATWAGIEPVWSNEIDPFCCKVLRKNFNHEIIEKDIKECGKHNLKAVDIIAAGVPCQPSSIAGKRKGTDDDRWLWDEAIRVVSELKPSYVICENPPGILSLEDGKPFQKILYALEDEGYNIELYNIPACSVGAWHRRERIIIIAYFNNISNQRGLVIRENKSKTKRSKGENEQPTRWNENRKRIRTKFNTNAQIVSNINGKGLEGENKSKKSIRFDKRNSGYNRANREIEPELVRLVHRIPNRMDRIKGLGNAIDPYVAYELFKAIINLENQITNTI